MTLTSGRQVNHELGEGESCSYTQTIFSMKPVYYLCYKVNIVSSNFIVKVNKKSKDIASHAWNQEVHVS